MSRLADILLLTVIPAELAAARRALGIDEQTQPEKSEQGDNYWLASVYSDRMQCEVTVALYCIGTQGNYDAATATSYMISHFKPKLAILMGIAAGIRGKVQIGNVILSDRVVAYEMAAIEGSGAAPPLYVNRPNVSSAPHSIHQDAIYYESLHRTLDDQFIALGGHWPTPSKGKKTEYAKNVSQSIAARGAVLASGEKLIRNPNVISGYRQTIHGKIELVEMEAAGFTTACSHNGVDWLVVRGISDFGDDLKSDEFHAFASLAASVVVGDFVRHAIQLNLVNTVEKVVLFVDDEPWLPNLFVSLLQERGYKTLMAHSVSEALQILATNHVDLTLIDIQLPLLTIEEYLRRGTEDLQVALKEIPFGGVNLNERIKMLYPNVSRVIYSAFADIANEIDDLDCAVISKATGTVMQVFLTITNMLEG